MPGTDLILINVGDLDSGNDGDGTGSDPTAAPGAVVNVQENAEVAVTAFFNIPTATPAVTTDTCTLTVQYSDDGGSTWAALGAFRAVLGSELPTGPDMTPVCLAIKVFTPTVQAAQSGVGKMRLNSVVSSARDYAVYSDVRTVQDIRTEWLTNAQIATA